MISATANSSFRRLPPLPNLRDLLRMYDIHAKKKLSQNFLMEPHLIQKIVRSAGCLVDKSVVEVGPGPGGLTRAILALGAKEVHVIEKDSRFLPSLNLLSEAVGGILKIRIGDVLHYNLEELIHPDFGRDWDDVEPDVCVIGNLPFNVSTPLLIRLLSAMSDRSNVFRFGRVPLLFTFQHEVAHRIVAPPGNFERCRLSIFCQNYATVDYLFRIPGRAFVPAPDVDVGVVRIVPLKKPFIDLPFKFVEKVVTTIFMGKRKFLRNTIKNLFPKKHNQFDLTDELFDMINYTSEEQMKNHPYILSMEEISKICHAYYHMTHKLYPELGLNKYVRKQVKEKSLDEVRKLAESEEASRIVAAKPDVVVNIGHKLL